jgi:DNA-binding transcriptional ArsR family regulator
VIGRFAVISFMLLLAPATALLDHVEDQELELYDTIADAIHDHKSENSSRPQQKEPEPEPYGGPASPAPITVPDSPLPVAIPSPRELITELLTVFGTLEEEIANLQDSIDLNLPTDESSDSKPQATLNTPENAKWYAQPAVWVAAAVAGTSAVAFFWVTGSSAAASGVRKPVFSPLFTRFEGEKVLEHPRRAELYAAVAEKPGICLQDLCVETQLSRTAVTHHLRLLEQQHVVVSKRVGRSRHFFENGGRYASNQKDAYALLQNDRSRTIMDLIRAEPGIIQKGICENLDLQASIAHWHIKRLSEAGLIDPIKQGRTVQYYANQIA